MQRLLSSLQLVAAVAALLHTCVTIHSIAEAQSTPGPPATATVCIPAWWGEVAVHGAFATRYYAAEFPGTSFRVKALNATNLRTTVRAFLDAGADCDAFGYSVTSSAAVALSPLMPTSVAWIGGSETSTELSDVVAHPAFNRVIPTDAIGAGGLATLALRFGWNLVSVVCEDNAYGRSLAEGFSAAFQKASGAVDFSRCFNSNVPMEEKMALVNEVVGASRSRVLFLASSNGALIDELARQQQWRRTIFLFPESACSAGVLSRFPGSFCATYATIASRLDPYNTAFRNRDTSVDASVFPLANAAWTQSYLHQLGAATFWGALSVDATRAMMRAIYSYHTANRSVYPTMATYVRTVAFNGLTGYVSFAPNGDREAATLAVYNSQPNATNQTQFIRTEVALIDNSNFTFQASQRLYFGLDDASGYLSAAPSGMKPVPPPKKEFPWWPVVVAALVVALGALLLGRHVRAKLALSRCPLDAGQPFTCMFVSIQNEASVRDKHPDDCAAAFAKVTEMARAAIRRSGCHEARRVNETTLLIVAKDPQRAVECAGEIVTAVASHRWEKMLRPKQHTQRANIRDDCTVSTSRRSKQTGKSKGTKRSTGSGGTTTSLNEAGKIYPPLVNIGLHTGLGEIEHNEETGVVSYHGSVVDQAAHVADAGVGDHVVVSEAASDRLAAEKLEGALQEYRRLGLPVTGASQRPSRQLEMALYTFVPVAFPAEAALMERITQANTRRENAEDDVAGGCATALSQADSGFARRRVAVVCAMIPSLALQNTASGPSDLDHASRVGQVLDDLLDLCDRHKAKVVRLVDSRAVLAVNASGPHVSQPDVRAAMIAHHLTSELPLIAPIFKGTTCGVASGRSLEGAAAGVATSLGATYASARMMQQAASALGLHALAADTGYDDLRSTFTCRTVDAVALPLGSGPRAPTRVTRLVELQAPKDSAADGEWLYMMGHDSSGGVEGGSASDDTASVEAAWARLAESPDDKPKTASDATPDHPAHSEEDTASAPVLSPDVAAAKSSGPGNATADSVAASVAAALADLNDVVDVPSGGKIARRQLIAATKCASLSAYCSRRVRELQLVF